MAGKNSKMTVAQKKTPLGNRTYRILADLHYCRQTVKRRLLMIRIIISLSYISRLSFTSEIVKKGNLLTTLESLNDFELTRLLSTWIRNIKPFRENRSCSRNRRAHSRDTINIFHLFFCRSVLKVTDPRSVTYSMASRTRLVPDNYQ